MNLKDSLHYYRIHVLAWALFIGYETIVVGLIFNIWGHVVTYTVHYLFAIILFYVHSEVILPWSLKGNGLLVLKLVAAVVTELFLYVIVSYAMDHFLVICHIINEPDLKLTVKYALKALYREIYLMGFSTAYYFIKNFIAERKKTVELEKQRMNDIIAAESAEKELMIAKNAFLKAQVNPHFLFNTLDFVNYKVAQYSPEASEAILILSDIMRYAIEADKMNDKIPVEDEIGHMAALIDLHRIKKGSPPNIVMKYDEQQIEHALIIPLILLTLLENMFKHGDVDQPNHPAMFSVGVADNELRINVSNLCASGRSVRSGRRGLDNIAQRLAYTYGKDASLEFRHDEVSNYFHIAVRIPFEDERKAILFRNNLTNM